MIDAKVLAQALRNEDGIAAAWCRNDVTASEYAKRLAAEYKRLVDEGSATPDPER